jgi:transcriptional antiterminator RfaH
MTREITWCVVYTQALKESMAAQNLLEQGFEVYLPRFKKTRRHARKVDEVLAPLFPRYVFVGMDRDVAEWRSINGTRGVSHLLMTDDRNPAHVPSTVIEALKAQEVSAGVVPVETLATFAKGEKVRVLEGAFKDQVGVFEGLDDKSRVQLLLSFLGRDTPISLPSYAVEGA